MRYAKAYFASDYGDAERLPLMDVMLDVANDFATADEALGRRAWNVVADILRATRELHRRQLDDWCAFDDPLEDCFAISPHTRALYAELFGSRA
ncbi:MAG: hypothetical protein HYV09_27490 [Deltaproteobacteria bacterium]|nr:hypothetical protein [Deltaproteobacteria bacterium]